MGLPAWPRGYQRWGAVEGLSTVELLRRVGEEEELDFEVGADVVALVQRDHGVGHGREQRVALEGFGRVAMSRPLSLSQV